ncbi:MAG: DUF547 domain-containing protein [Candidatus Glassbacteria bacterium]
MQVLRMFLVLVLLGLTGSFRQADTGLVNPGQAAAAEVSADGFNWSSYARLLRIYTDGRGLVNYRRLADDREILDNVVADLGAVPVREFSSWDDQSRMAFLINAYNLFTIRAVVDNYPIKRRLLMGLLYPANSIRQIAGVWDELRFQLLGSEVTLDQIEHDLLLGRFNQPRVHMALARASKSCPRLQGEPYTGGQLDSLLEHQTRGFLADPGNFAIDPEKKTVSLSPIFKTYGEDFLRRYASQAQAMGLSEAELAVMNFVSRYVSQQDQRFINSGGYQLEYLDYDWSLNELEDAR